MRIPRLYLPQPLSAGRTVVLDERTFQHAVRVLRLPVHAPLILFNSDDGAFSATLSYVQKRSATALLTEHLPSIPASPLSITLVQALSRADRMDYTVQKAVELGVAAIQPVLTERGGALYEKARLGRKMIHWQGIIVSACEQCGRDQLPALHAPLPLNTWLSGLLTNDQSRLLLDPTATHRLRDQQLLTGTVALLIGAEGGLSPKELRQAQAVGFTGIQLGPRVLRTETAGVAALAALQALWGDG